MFRALCVREITGIPHLGENMMTNETESSATAIADLFNLDAQVGPLHDLPIGVSSEDCTSDTCTQSCVGCRGDS